MNEKGLSIVTQLSKQVKSTNLIEICLLGLLKLFLQEDNHFFYISARCHAQNDVDRFSTHFHVDTVLIVRDNRDKMIKMD
jgi:hypothetical protein